MYDICNLNVRSHIMIRTQICLTKKEKLELDKRSRKIGISMAELIRRILDKSLNEKQYT